MALPTNTKRRIFSRSTCLVFFLLGVCIFHLVSTHGHNHGHAHDDHGHGHAHDDHGHSHEVPSFKYSRKANAEAQKESPPGSSQRSSEHAHEHHGHASKHQGHENHGHSHDQPQEHHGHSHDHHGHSHDHHGHSHDHQDHRDHAKENADTYWRDAKPASKPKPDTSRMWLQAIGATALISAAPVLILLFIPLENADEHKELLKVLLSFASGGLLGDAFLHLIPHAISPHSHGDEGHGHEHKTTSQDHGHSHENHSHDVGVGLWVLSGIIVFLMVEKFVRYVKGEQGHGHSHSVGTSPPKSPEKPARKKGKGKAKHSDTEDESKTDEKSEAKTASKEKTDENIDDEAEDKSKARDKTAENSGDAGTSSSKVEETKAADHSHGSDIKVAGYLNLAADFAHNFTDGLAIGASFLAGQSVGVVTTITIFLHEIPHEVGDFAILIQSGCSKKKAMLLQFTTALGAMLGTLCSLSMEGIGEAATAWILPFTAGGFIYIATVSVIPELLGDTKIGQSIKEIFALVTGVYMMMLIAQYE